MNKRQREDRQLQTAQELGQEYSNHLNKLAVAYENLSGKKISFDEDQFWESAEVRKTETLVAFWWRIKQKLSPEEFI